MPYSNKLDGLEAEIRKLFDSGMSDTKISEKFSVTRQAIQKYRKTHGMIITAENKFFNGNNYKLASHKDEIISMNERGISDVEIAKNFGVTQTAILYFRRTIGLSAIKQYNFRENDNPIFDFNPYNPVELMKTDLGQVLVGTLLGDGCITTKIKLLVLGHSIHQRAYCEYKMRKLAPFTFVSYIKKGTFSGFGNGTDKFVARTPVYPFLKFMHKRFYPEGKKKIPIEYIELMDARGLLIWIYDDGSFIYSPDNYHNAVIKLCTKGFDPVDLEKVIKIFKKRFGLNHVKRTLTNEIYFSRADTIKLCKIFAQTEPKGLSWKDEKIKIIANLKIKK